MKTGDFRGAEGTLAEGAEAARRAGDRRSELRIAVERQAHRWFTAPVQTSDENLRVAREVIPELEALGDDLGLTKAWRLLSDGHATACRWQHRVEALERALEHARRTPEARPEISGIVGQLAQALHYGPTPVPEAIARCRELLESEAQDRAARAGVASSLAPLFAAEGAFDEARTLYADGMALYDELGLHFRRTVRALDGAEIELLGGELGEAERILREAYETLERMGETGVRAVVAAFLADVLCRRSADEEAAEFADVAEELAEADDIAAQVVRRSVQARVLARAGRLDEAEGLATEAVELADRTDFLTLRADARIGLAEVRGDRALLDEARALYERKGNVSAIRALAAAL
jgi:tetratricopeptide (TPR) repeat protein